MDNRGRGESAAECESDASMEREVEVSGREAEDRDGSEGSPGKSCVVGDVVVGAYGEFENQFLNFWRQFEEGAAAVATIEFRH